MLVDSNGEQLSEHQYHDVGFLVADAGQNLEENPVEESPGGLTQAPPKSRNPETDIRSLQPESRSRQP